MARDVGGLWGETSDPNVHLEVVANRSCVCWMSGAMRSSCLAPARRTTFRTKLFLLACRLVPTGSVCVCVAHRWACIAAARAALPCASCCPASSYLPRASPPGESLPPGPLARARQGHAGRHPRGDHDEETNHAGDRGGAEVRHGGVPRDARVRGPHGMSKREPSATCPRGCEAPPSFAKLGVARAAPARAVGRKEGKGGHQRCPGGCVCVCLHTHAPRRSETSCFRCPTPRLARVLDNPSHLPPNATLAQA